MENKRDRIFQTAVVEVISKGGLFCVSLEDNPEHRVWCRQSGNMRRNSITLIVGDRVRVELSKYDLTRGRITWRLEGGE